MSNLKMRTNELAAKSLLDQGRHTESGEFIVAIRSYGADVAIVLPDETCLEPLIPLLPPTWEPTDVSREGQHTIHWTDTTSPASQDYHGVVASLASQVEYEIAERSPDYVFVHAGVVVIDGKALLLPGESHAGKSTLVAALVRHGATYFSDEYAVITNEGLVLPYHRQIVLRNSLFFPEGRTDLSAHTLAADEISGGVAVSLMLFSRYEENRAWSCTSLDRTSALIELCKNTVGFRERPDMSFAHLGRIVEHASGYSCVRGEATDTIPHIMALTEL